MQRHLAGLSALVTIVAGIALGGAQSDPIAGRFIAHTIDTGLTGGYQVVVADLNRDGKPDIIALASGLKELRWYENPGWQPHVLVSRHQSADQRRRPRCRRRRHPRDRARTRVLQRVRAKRRASSRS